MSALPQEPIGEPAVRVPTQLQPTLDLVGRLAALHEAGKANPGFAVPPEAANSGEAPGGSRPLGRARKVSVSLPEGLTAAIQQRVGKGEFSHYVAEAVARQLELDLLVELSELLEAEHGAVPEEYLAEAAAAWPDAG